MAVVKGFEKGEVNLARLNFARINLIPKEEGVNSLKKFRLISLINCSFKIFAKALNNRLVRICDRLLAPNQTAFVRGGDTYWRVWSQLMRSYMTLSKTRSRVWS
jgi:hypothetical protein